MTEEKKPDPALKPAPKYDPMRAWYDRQTPTTRANIQRRQNHQFSQDIGGCADNYRRGS